MRLLQLNTHRSRPAQDLLVATARRRHVDVVLVSEPNRSKLEGGSWIPDLDGDTALSVVSKDIVTIRTGAGKGVVWVELQDIVIISCYFSPNKSLGEFAQRLDELSLIIWNQNKDVIVAGDFNSKSPEWGGNILDNRGQLLADWAASCDLSSLNTGQVPTFERGNYGSFLDVTFGSARATQRLKSWQVLEDESLSDHRYIMFEVNTNSINMRSLQNNINSNSWRVGATKQEHLRSVIRCHLNSSSITTTAQLVETVREACEEALPKRSRKGRRSVYW